MSDYALRRYCPGDEAALRTLWKEGFGDSDEYIDCFFRAFLRPDSCVVAEADGVIVSAMYLLEGPTLFPYRRNQLTSGYCYALATLPAYRKRGIGSAVYKACCALAFERGYDAACVLPARQELYPFYEKATGARVISAVREMRYNAEELRTADSCACARVDITRYGGIREAILSGEAHGVTPESFYEWQEELTGRLFDGGLFVLDSGVAEAEIYDGVCYINELLIPGGEEKAAAAAVASYCPAKEYVLRAPAYWDGPGEIKPFMLASFKTAPAFFVPDDVWWGLAFE